MLVISRRVGQKILIGDDIVVMFVSREGNKVRIGIEAPKDIPIHRDDSGRHTKKEPDAPDADDMQTADWMDRIPNL